MFTNSYRDYSRNPEREEMVQRQLVDRGIKDPRVLEAFLKVPRHCFVPSQSQSEAYADHPIDIGNGQTISQPYMVAAMIESMMLKGKEKVLEVGTGSGYESAIIAELVLEVYTIERIPELLSEAESRLKGLGYKNIQFRCGDGTGGWKENSPYEAIIVSAGAPAAPNPLVDQMGEGGRLVLPEGDLLSQTLVRITRVSGSTKKESLMGCRFVPLIGEFGWAK